jgi:hypothetical protein
MYQAQWLMLVIPATGKAEIRRIVVQTQFWTNTSQDPIWKIPTTHKKGLAEWLKQ